MKYSEDTQTTIAVGRFNMQRTFGGPLNGHSDLFELTATQG